MSFSWRREEMSVSLRREQAARINYQKIPRVAPQQAETQRKSLRARPHLQMHDTTRTRAITGRTRGMINSLGLAMAVFFISSSRAIGFWLLQIALRSPLGARGQNGTIQNPAIVARSAAMHVAYSLT
jgi:hypothetical protein